jgi:para-aminobenzoate synthetase / 4-amino-4-deoxychorismate lyase
MLPFDPAKAFVWLEDSRGPSTAGQSWLFRDCLAVETAADGNMSAAFARLRQATKTSWVAGWMSYEAGYHLEPKLIALARPDDALMWFGQFQDRQAFMPEEIETLWRHPVTTPAPPFALDVQPLNTTQTSYEKAVTRILDYIAAGDVYQINFTYPLAGSTAENPVALYRRLRESQRVPYGALIHDGAGNWILSFSPELFFRIDDGVITAKPMKGTAPRHPLPESDQGIAARLQQDPKNRAENLMIVDLLRNDLSRIAETGSVHVPDLYSIETYTTVHQLTSTITARLAAEKDAIDALATLFPCGSVTGAPKIRAMQIIREIEPQPRGVYCGAIGWIGPDNSACFNVPIRTLQLSAREVTFGLGSGIVADSIPASEWQECADKGSFLTRNTPPFDLFETMLWQTAFNVWEQQAHLQRLAASAQYWGFPVDMEKWQKALADFCENLTIASRIRLLLSRSGEISLQSAILAPSPAQPVKLAVSPNIMRSDNPFLYHKTTHRAFYDDERTRLAKHTGCFECIFTNERGEITEGSFTTLFIRKGGRLLTPALPCGLLPGIQRQKLIDHQGCEEAILTLDDVRNAETILIGNSVRGLLGAVLTSAMP